MLANDAASKVQPCEEFEQRISILSVQEYEVKPGVLLAITWDPTSLLISCDLQVFLINAQPGGAHSQAGMSNDAKWFLWKFSHHQWQASMISSFTHGLLFSPLWSGRRREKASVWLPFSRKRINRRWDLASWPKSFTASLLHAHEGWPAYTKVTVSILLPALAAKVCRWIWPCSPDPRSSELSWEMPLVVVELKLFRFQKKLVYWSMVGFIGKHSYLFQEQGNRWFENMGGSHWKSLIFPVSQDYPIHSECWRSYLPDDPSVTSDEFLAPCP